MTKYDSIQHVETASYHLCSNDLAERAVKTKEIKKYRSESESIDCCLARMYMLFQYKFTPHSTTGVHHIKPKDEITLRFLITRFSYLVVLRQKRSKKKYIFMTVISETAHFR